MAPALRLRVCQAGWPCTSAPWLWPSVWAHRGRQWVPGLCIWTVTCLSRPENGQVVCTTTYERAEACPGGRGSKWLGHLASLGTPSLPEVHGMVEASGPRPRVVYHPCPPVHRQCQAALPASCPVWAPGSKGLSGGVCMSLPWRVIPVALWICGLFILPQGPSKGHRQFTESEGLP